MANVFTNAPNETKRRQIVSQDLLACFRKSKQRTAMRRTDRPIPTLMSVNVVDLTVSGDGESNVSFKFSSYSSTSCSERTARSSRSFCQKDKRAKPKYSMLTSSCSSCISMDKLTETPSSWSGPSSTVAETLPTNQDSSSNADLKARRITT